jgi:RNA polymerase subunit RPABC4/transcription elongation factor Spt4
MALVACRECTKEISSEAPACPHRGVPKVAGAPCRHCASPVAADAPICPSCGAVGPVRRSSGPGVGKMILMGIGSLIGLFVLLVVIGALMRAGSGQAGTPRSSNTSPPSHTDIVATGAIRDAGHPCALVTSSSKMSDGSIRALCSNGESYRVSLIGGRFVAMRCSAARQLGITGC